MKKGISILICCVLIFSSFSFSFAAVSDAQAQTIVSNLSTIITHLSTISSRLNTIQGYLYDSGHSVAYWVAAIDSWMQPIYGSLTDILSSSLNMETVAGLLGSVDTSGSTVIRTPYLFYNGKSAANWLSDLYSLDNRNGAEGYGGIPTIYLPSANGSYTSWQPNLSTTNWRNSLFTVFKGINDNIAFSYSYEFQHRDNGYNSLQSLVSFADPNSTVTFTPISATDGLYKYLNAINTPVARLAYVLASDSRIEAQQAAAANEQAVVDNFIDSSGNGSASTSDFSSISSASNEFKTNFNSGASAGGIWDVFNSDHGNWFSQSIADSLDTSGSGNRNLKSGSSFETPLLDQQIEDIYKALGGDKK